MPENQPISKFYKFRPVSDQILKDLFAFDNLVLDICNIYEPYDKEKYMYLWVSVFDLSFLDSIEKVLNPKEVDIEEIRKIELDLGNYKTRKDIP